MLNATIAIHRECLEEQVGQSGRTEPGKGNVPDRHGVNQERPPRALQSLRVQPFRRRDPK